MPLKVSEQVAEKWFNIANAAIAALAPAEEVAVVLMAVAVDLMAVAVAEAECDEQQVQD
jgi:uncharacterized protein YxjI